MDGRTRRRGAALALAAALTLVPGTAWAATGGGGPSWWSWLWEGLAGLWAKDGWAGDPNGLAALGAQREGKGGGPGVTAGETARTALKDGPGVDPSGSPAQGSRPPASAPSDGETDDGWAMDPNG
jgi:hypothetical protein